VFRRDVSRSAAESVGESVPTMRHHDVGEIDFFSDGQRVVPVRLGGKRRHEQSLACKSVNVARREPALQRDVKFALARLARQPRPLTHRRVKADPGILPRRWAMISDTTTVRGPAVSVLTCPQGGSHSSSIFVAPCLISSKMIRPRSTSWGPHSANPTLWAL